MKGLMSACLIAVLLSSGFVFAESKMVFAKIESPDDERLGCDLVRDNEDNPKLSTKKPLYITIFEGEATKNRYGSTACNVKVPAKVLESKFQYCAVSSVTYNPKRYSDSESRDIAWCKFTRSRDGHYLFSQLVGMVQCEFVCLTK